MFFDGLTAWTPGNVLFRMAAALILGSLIGIDRGAKKRGGGARTDAAVCLGAARVMITAQYMDKVYPGGTDLSRMAAQVISGVGFLGAGSIIVSGHQVKGLTSAASIWICACIGLAAGIGFVDGAFLAAVLLLGGLHVIPLIEERVYRHSRYVRLYVEANDSRTMSVLLYRLKEDGCKIDMFDLDKSKPEGGYYTIMLTVRLPIGAEREAYLRTLAGTEGVLSVGVM